MSAELIQAKRYELSQPAVPMLILDWIKTNVKNQLTTRGFSLTRLSELTQLADRFGSDKGTRLSAHLYTRIYEKYFETLRYRPIYLLEIGLLRSDIDRRRAMGAVEGKSDARAFQAPSLKMWSEYFPNGKIFGYDIDDFSDVKMDRCTILQGDMSSRLDLDKLVRTVGQPLDVVIEDASHVSHHQQIALGALFPHVRSGGLYFIEDLHWQDPSLEKKEAPKTRELMRKLQVQGTFESPYLSEEERSYICQYAASVSLFDSLSRDTEDTTDAIAVLVKK